MALFHGLGLEEATTSSTSAASKERMKNSYHWRQICSFQMISWSKIQKIFNVHSSHLVPVTCLFMILEDAENKNTTRLGSWLQAGNSGVLHAQPLLLPNAFDRETSFQQGRKLQFSLANHWPLVTFRSCSNDLR